jgi:mannosyltransferase OCH1-like enzyme
MIPKIAYLSWKTRDIVNSNSPIIANGLNNLIQLNKNWSITIYEDDDVDNYLKLNLDSSLYKLIENFHIVAKTDVWRLLKQYNEGGLYIDIDRLCNISLDSIVTDSIKWVLPTCLDLDFSHDFMMSAPNNPVYEIALNLYFQRRINGYTNTYFLGPQTYMHAVTQALIGQQINSNPGQQVFGEIRAKIAEMSFIKTYREHPPHMTIINKQTPVDWDHETEKRRLYAEYNLKHWTGDW